LHNLDNKKLDALIDGLKEGSVPKRAAIIEMISLIRGVKVDEKRTPPVVERAKAMIVSSICDEITVAEIAERLNISIHYLCHIFKSETGITPIDYRNSVKLTKAKKLLVGTDNKISDIALECGFGSASYFSKLFGESEEITPAEYRKLHKR
jgi:AraC-like DNA-binding protein